MSYYDNEYVVVDIETTGLSPYNGDEIIEIGITEIIDGKIGRNYSRLIKPNGFISSTISRITNITNEMVENEKSIEDVLPNFRKFIGDRTVIAHNAKFDVGFLNFYLEKNGLQPIESHICTLDMVKKNKKYKGKNRKLESLCEYYGITNEMAHRAYADSYVTAKLFLILREEIFGEMLF